MTDDGAGRYRKKRVEVDAIHYSGRNLREVEKWIDGWLESGPDDEDLPPDKEPGVVAVDVDSGTLLIRTLEGTLNVAAGYWIVRGIKGEFYPVRPDIFKATYEPTNNSKRRG